MRRSRRDDLQPPSFDTNLHQKDFDLRFGGAKDSIGRPIKPKAKKKENKTQQLKSKVSLHKQRQRQRQKDETKNSSQCNEYGERYSIQDVTIHGDTTCNCKLQT